MIALPMLVLGALGGLGVHLEDAVDVALGDAAAVAEALGRALGHRTGREVRVDDLVWSKECGAPDRCVAEIAARLEVEEVVLVQVYGGPIKLRVIAELFGKRAAHVEVKLPRDLAGWTGVLEAAAVELFPIEVRPQTGLLAAPSLTNTATVARSDRGPLPWIVLGASALAAGAGVAFGLSSQSARDEIQNGGLITGDRFRALDDARSARATAANACFGAAIAGAITGVVLLILE